MVKITRIVGSLEKLKNLFMWTDPLLTFYFIIVLSIVYLIIYKIDLRYLMLFSFIKKFIFGLFYYKHKFNNNKEIGRILLKYCVSEWRRENKVKFKSTVSEINFGLIRVYDQKFIKLIKQIFNDNSNVYFNDTMFNLINSLGDIHDELCKCERVLKIKRNSALYRYVLRNNKIISPEIDPEDVFF